jgi:hypothetical protein
MVFMRGNKPGREMRTTSGSTVASSASRRAAIVRRRKEEAKKAQEEAFKASLKRRSQPLAPAPA